MCGACPGGGVLSEGTLYLALRIAPARTAKIFSNLTGDRLRIGALGDTWSVGLPTGGMVVVTSFEQLVTTCAPYVSATGLRAARARLDSQPDEGLQFILDRVESTLGRPQIAG